MDIVTKKERSKMMAGIKSKNTKPEIIIRKILFRSGFRYRLSTKVLGIKPDIVLKKWKICIFVHGCFWHRHENCTLASIPKSNVQFWKKKFEGNVLRDKKAIDILQKNNWKVGIIWECAIRNRETDFSILPTLIKDSTLWTIP